MLYCCELFEQYIDNAGLKGTSFLIRQLGEVRGIFLQSRACDASDEAELVEQLKSGGANKMIRLVDQVGIPFCPFCGKRTSDLIVENSTLFDELVVAHALFQLGDT